MVGSVTPMTFPADLTPLSRALLYEALLLLSHRDAACWLILNGASLEGGEDLWVEAFSL